MHALQSLSSVWRILCVLMRKLHWFDLSWICYEVRQQVDGHIHDKSRQIEPTELSIRPVRIAAKELFMLFCRESARRPAGDSEASTLGRIAQTFERLLGRVSYIGISLCYFCFRWKTVSLVQASMQHLIHHMLRLVFNNLKLPYKTIA